jgi:hypothetical protein
MDGHAEDLEAEADRVPDADGLAAGTRARADRGPEATTYRSV